MKSFFIYEFQLKYNSNYAMKEDAIFMIFSYKINTQEKLHRIHTTNNYQKVNISASYSFTIMHSILI